MRIAQCKELTRQQPCPRATKAPRDPQSSCSEDVCAVVTDALELQHTHMLECGTWGKRV